VQIIQFFKHFQKMSLTPQDLKEIKATLSQILQNQSVMMAHIALLMNNLQQANNIPMPTSPINSAMTQSFLEGLKLKLKLISPQPAKPPPTIGPQKRKAELPLDNMVNAKHRRAHSQKPEDVVVSKNDAEENVAAVNENTTEFAFMVDHFLYLLMNYSINFSDIRLRIAYGID